MVCGPFPPSPCQERLVQLLGSPPPGLPQSWHTEAVASRMLINFIPAHSTKQGKNCSGAALSKEVLSKHNVARISAELGGGRYLEERLVWMGKFWLFFEEQNPNVGLITFLVIHCLCLCVEYLLRGYWPGL